MSWFEFINFFTIFFYYPLYTFFIFLFFSIKKFFIPSFISSCFNSEIFREPLFFFCKFESLRTSLYEVLKNFFPPKGATNAVQKFSSLFLPSLSLFPRPPPPFSFSLSLSFSHLLRLLPFFRLWITNYKFFFSLLRSFSGKIFHVNLSKKFKGFERMLLPLE